MQYKEIKILNKLGMHARASAKFTQLASRYRSDVWLSRNDRKVNAKSIMGVMMLAANQGATLVIETAGEDEIEAMQALVQLIEDRFGESE
ncbi:phosphocarrier protein [Nitrosospira multiformis]|uniref:Phosphocarrier protein n=1 Tax=Nitrosospira multiformis TaxID=1231 RepID=A0A1H8M8Z4_9PROT|nr:HPr family phosphocarrier protein [Nitrosospira multiformis]SEO13809.1 phosphocarrier protein [Nitrosospira multiformis]SES87435.1 phosphocarrier protein [Nitrosospira multiformis]